MRVNHQTILKKGLFVLAIVGIAQLVAQKIGLYWIYPNFDIPMHFFGGVWLGFLATWAVLRFSLVKQIDSMMYLFVVGVVAFLVGFGWEAFEYLVDGWLRVGMQINLIDTKLDLVMDLLGAYCVALGILIHNRNKKEYVFTER